jgi:hypothetical protein
MRSTPAILGVLLAASLEVSTLAVRLSAQPADAAAGIARITGESHKEAIACGKSGADCAVAPYRICASENKRYSAWIATPFSRVAASIYDALQKHQRPRAMEAGDANMWGVGIYVYPSEDYDSADSIERVQIRRAGEIIEPKTTTIAPVTSINPAGMKKELSKGFFAFPMDVFTPTSEITIVLIGSSGEMTCTFDRPKLSALR